MASPRCTGRTPFASGNASGTICLHFERARLKARQAGWFHSGGLGVMRADGYIELRDRMKDIIISGGENISTIEVERALYQHPSVLEAAVIAYTRERLAHFKCPRAIEFGALPKTSTGKIQKFVLRDREWAGFEKRIH